MVLDTNTVDRARNFKATAARALGPVATAGILPSEAYTCEHLWAFEKERIFAHEWLCIGHVNEVANPGDHLPMTILDEPILLVRDGDGTVRVLSAICQHRGHPMVGGLAERAPDAPCLNATRLVCPYHNWTYALDGSLVGAPDMRATTPLPELRSKIRLPEIRSEIFHGLVFITFAADAPPLAPSLTALDAELKTFPIADLVPAQQHSKQDLRWTWKLHHENALEPYHTSYVHRDYHDAVPSNLTSFYAAGPGDRAVMRCTRYAVEGSELFTEDGDRRLPEIEGLTDAQRNQVLFVSVMPNLVAVLQPSLVTMTILNPTSAGTLDTRRLNLYPRAAVDHPEFAEIAGEQFDRIKVIVGQDQTTQVALQKAYKSRFTPPGTLAWLESSLPQLNQWVVDAYDRALARIDA